MSRRRKDCENLYVAETKTVLASERHELIEHVKSERLASSCLECSCRCHWWWRTSHGYWRPVTTCCRYKEAGLEASSRTNQPTEHLAPFIAH